MKNHPELVPHTGRREHHITQGEHGDIPSADENSPIERRRNSRLILLYETSKLVGLFLPAVLLRIPDTFKLQGIGLNTLLQLVDLVAREPIVTNE